MTFVEDRGDLGLWSEVKYRLAWSFKSSSEHYTPVLACRLTDWITLTPQSTFTTFTQNLRCNNAAMFQSVLHTTWYFLIADSIFWNHCRHVGIWKAPVLTFGLQEDVHGTARQMAVSPDRFPWLFLFLASLCRGLIVSTVIMKGFSILLNPPVFFLSVVVFSCCHWATKDGFDS